jgi:type IV pilus assembly protein PilA
LIRKLNRAFTLIELMIVVAIVGILAVLAIFGVRKYVANAKTAEARNALGQMGKDQSTEFEKEYLAGGVMGAGSSSTISRTLCLSATQAVPKDPLSIQGKKYQPDPTSGMDWNKDDLALNTGFACLKFSMEAPQYFQYLFTSDAANKASGTTWLATAHGDLNGDTVVSTFTLAGAVTPTQDFILGPSIGEVDPEE